MKHTPKTIKRTLKRCINEISEHPEVFAKNPEKDFTRVRKLPFKQVIKSVLSMTGKSLRGELMEYFNLNPSMPTVSAFVQQRNKVNYRAFEKLFHSFTNVVDEQALCKGYRLLAVDGSDLQLKRDFYLALIICLFVILIYIVGSFKGLLSVASVIINSVVFYIGLYQQNYLEYALCIHYSEK